MADAAELSALLDRIDALKKENASLEAEIAGGSAVVMYDLACANESVRFSPYCWRVKMALAHKGVGPAVGAAVGAAEGVNGSGADMQFIPSFL